MTLSRTIVFTNAAESAERLASMAAAFRAHRLPLA